MPFLAIARSTIGSLHNLLLLNMKAYEACLGATSTSESPWYVFPADDKHNARLIVSQIILDTFEDLGMSYPKISPERERELVAIRKELAT